MSEQISIVIIICSVAAVVSVIIALKVQQRRLLQLRALHLVWEQEQLRNQQLWEVQQEKRLRELEAGFTTQMQQLQETWHHWEAEDSMLVATHVQQYKQEIARMNLEYELQRLPRIEDVPLP
jgi:hypothetical protein